MYIYIAGPLCSEAERQFNEDLNSFLHTIGIKTYLPQADGGFLDELIDKGVDEEEVRRSLFERDVNAMNSCDTLLIILDGRTIDEGACFELGYMYSKGKRCFGYKTDSRSYIRGKNNLMIDCALQTIVSSHNELKVYLENLKKGDHSGQIITEK